MKHQQIIGATLIVAAALKSSPTNV